MSVTLLALCLTHQIRTAPKANVTDFKLKCVFVDKPEFAEEVNK